MSKEEAKNLNREHYLRVWDELSKRELSASESRDRAILFTSLPIVGFAFALIPHDCNSILEWLRYVSSVMFIVSILSVISSFWTATLAKSKIQKLLRSYYLEQGEKPNTRWDKATQYLNIFASACYLLGIITMSFFFGFNFTQGTC